MNLAMPGILIEIIESIARDDISFNVPQTIDTKPDLWVINCIKITVMCLIQYFPISKLGWHIESYQSLNSWDSSYL